MFWTNLINTIGKITLVIMLIISVIGGLVSIAGGGFLLGLIVLVCGVLISFLSVAGMMMLCEISENIYTIKLKICSERQFTNDIQRSKINNYSDLTKNAGRVIK